MNNKEKEIQSEISHIEYDISAIEEELQAIFFEEKISPTKYTETVEQLLHRKQSLELEQSDLWSRYYEISNKNYTKKG